jgi:predicted dehydrogenase/threonine dehydrogenase-like Zn-dependent dehydrogenase
MVQAACGSFRRSECSVKQVVRSSRKGEVRVDESAVPRPGARDVLVRNAFSLLSAGTEKSALEFDEKSLIAKARSRPDLVRKVVDRARREGVGAALTAALNKLDEVRPLGYSCAGIVEAVGSDVTAGTLRPGMRVACSGANYANHAEFVSVPASLCTPIPGNVSFDSACYVTVASIALHGVRLANPTLGERAAVIGCGLIGQITVQMLVASGVSVLAIDTNPQRVELAVARGAARGACLGRDDVRSAAAAMTDGFGVDFAIVCASTASSDPIDLAAEICRDRGRVISVGATGLTLPRRPFYEKELSFNISRSYGPGRYDPAYEEGGIDYPIGYVRWTEGRNFEAVLDLIARGALNLEMLTTHRFPIERATEAYDLIRSGGEPFLGVLLEYPVSHDPSSGLRPPPRTRGEGELSAESREGARAPLADAVSFIGAGAFARAVLLPAFRKAGARFGTIASAAGLSASDLGKKFEFARIASEHEATNDESASVVIVTRHDSHAPLAAEALGRGKNVFVEKPLAITSDGLDDVLDAASGAKGVLMVGFNRRFAPASRLLRDTFAKAEEPLVMHARVNAGAIPMNHWIQSDEIGGGRIIGEACHFVDWMTFVCGSLPVQVYAAAVDANRADFPNRDQCAMTLRFANGSVGTIAYVARGDTRLAKEYFEVFAGGMSAVLDDFRKLTLYSGGRGRVLWRGAQDKGHSSEVAEFLRATRDKKAPISLAELRAVTLATFAAEESLRSGMPVAIG